MAAPRWTAVIALAIAGLVLVAGVTYLASTLVSQPIGLASEPATLGESLAPPKPAHRPKPKPVTRPKPVKRRKSVTKPTATATIPSATTPTTTAPTTATQPPSDDSGGQRDSDD